MLASLTAVLILSASTPSSTEAVTTTARPNVLVVIFDDLRPAVAGFSNPGTQSIVTPSLNRLLADPGTTVMDRAFVQQAVCGSVSQDAPFALNLSRAKSTLAPSCRT